MEGTIQSPLQEQEACIPCPRGGPIFVPSAIGPLTRVPDFEASVWEELKSLEAELLTELTQSCDDDLSVEDLKIFTEEELVEKAFKEAFKDAEQTENLSQIPNEQPIEMKTDYLGSQNLNFTPEESLGHEPNNFEASESLNYNENCSERMDKKNPKKGKKRGRTFDRNHRASELESAYIAKVEHLAKIKQRQDEGKSDVKLHSFNAKISDGSISTPEEGERMRSLSFVTSAVKVKPSNVEEGVPVHYPEVVLCIEIYHNIKKLFKMQEFLVLGSQTLTKLRDRIYCLTDHLMQIEGKHDPSGYFLIENLFCNDMRDPTAIDYSEPVIDWIRNFKEEALVKWDAIVSGGLRKKEKALLGDLETSTLPHFKATDMDKIRFCDLYFRLGSGYLYCHQGDCKHMLVIRDMRLIHPEDVQNRSAYPLLIYQPRRRYTKCSICDIYRATKVTCDDKWAPENPSYFCNNCYYLLHYSEDGSLLYNNFTVYDYHHE